MGAQEIGRRQGFQSLSVYDFTLAWKKFPRKKSYLRMRDLPVLALILFKLVLLRVPLRPLRSPRLFRTIRPASPASCDPGW